MNKVDTYKRGHRAELWASIYLRFKGYKILERRYKTKAGEIDLIARHGQALVFIEVKARQTLDTALQSITPKAQARIAKAALTYCIKNPEYHDYTKRFDAIAVLSPFSIHHLDNAWSDPT